MQDNKTPANQSPSSRPLPLPPGAWRIDLAHSSVGFSVRHLAISRVRGQFRSFDATLTVGDTLADSRLEATIDLSSVDTNQPDRDAHLRSTDFFDADQHPTMTFSSAAISSTETGRFDVTGDLVLNGATSRLILDVRFEGTEVFPGDGLPHAGFTATGTINRLDHGVDFNVPLGADTFVISDRVDIELDAQFVASSEATR